MAKTKTVVDQVAFKAAITTVEAKGPLSNRGVLFAAVTDEYNKKNKEAQITVQITGLRMNEWNLLDTLKTPKGKRGRPAGSKNSAKVTVVVPEVPATTETVDVPVETPEAPQEATGTAPVVAEVVA